MLAKGRVEEARNVIKYGTKLTGVKISDEVLIDSTSPSRTKHIEAESENLGKKIITKYLYLWWISIQCRRMSPRKMKLKMR